MLDCAIAHMHVHPCLLILSSGKIANIWASLPQHASYSLQQAAGCNAGTASCRGGSHGHLSTPQPVRETAGLLGERTGKELLPCTRNTG
jgi:hypothetical protein